MIPEAPENHRYIPSLDGIRAIAITLVIPHNIDLLRPPVPLVAYPAALVMHSGWIGVQLFFVLSGFLITGNLLDARNSANYFSVFFGRRALRILPLYFGMLTFTFLVLPAVGTLPEELRATTSHQIWLWTFLVNWTQPFGAGVSGFTHFWSLAVEEQFYLIWPFVVLRCSPQALLKICSGVIAGALAIRILLLTLHTPVDAIYMFTVCRMDALAFGAASAALLRMPEALTRLHRSINLIAWLTVAAFVITLLGTSEFAMHDVRTQSVGYTTLSFAFALGILLAALPTVGIPAAVMRFLAWGPLRRVGRYSYGMYVFHLPLHVFFGAPTLYRLVPKLTPAIILEYTAAMMVATFVLAALSFELFERRFLKMKRLLTTAAPAVAT
jgi:peptidoglycan/LPS O-acetylase OafA/YrhL